MDAGILHGPSGLGLHFMTGRGYAVQMARCGWYRTQFWISAPCGSTLAGVEGSVSPDCSRLISFQHLAAGGRGSAVGSGSRQERGHPSILMGFCTEA